MAWYRNSRYEGIYISEKELADLQKNSALADLKQLLSEDTIKALYPGAIAMGACNEKIIGLPLSVYVRTLLTTREYWENNTWTVEDVLQILGNEFF